MNSKSFILASLKIAQEKLPKISQQKAALLISVGQKEHEGENFAATIDMLNSLKYKKVTIVVADTLQRHTIKGMNDISDEEAYLKSKESGDIWLNNNSKYIKDNEIFEIMRWDEIKKNSFYTEYYNSLLKMHNEKDSPLSKAINETAKTFSKRYDKFIIDENRKQIIENCSIMYLLEELPILSMIFGKIGIDDIIYPASEPKALTQYNHELNNFGEKSNIEWCQFSLRERDFNSIKSSLLAKNNGFSCGRNRILDFLNTNNYYINGFQNNRNTLFKENQKNNEENSVEFTELLTKQKKEILSSIELLAEEERNIFLENLKCEIETVLRNRKCFQNVTKDNLSLVQNK